MAVAAGHRRRMEPQLGRALLRNLVAYWPLDEASGTRRDLSGNGLTLTDNNTVTGAEGPSARLPLASQFTRANSEYLSRASSATLQTGDIDLTVCIWGYLDTEPAANAYMGLINKYLTAGQREWLLGWRDDATRSQEFYFTVSNDGTAIVNVYADAAGATATATWYFVRAWHDSVANTINIQINNGAINSAAHATGIFAGTDPVELGRAVTHHWDGRMAGAGIWKNRLWTPAEHAYMYNNGAGRMFVAGRGFV